MMSGSDSDVVLDVRDLHTEIRTASGIVRPVSGVSFTLERGEVLGIVGESGSGKSMTALSIMRLLPGRHVKITGGQIVVGGRDLVALSDREMREVRGSKVAMVLQEPLTSLDPVYSIGDQLAEPLRIHRKLRGEGLKQRIIDGLRAVHIPDPQARVGNYPHQMSGGMRQRVVTAMALSCQPDVLIADEPTTALDVTIQAQVVRLFEEVRDQGTVGTLLITHDFGIVAQLCRRVAVMYAGRIVEMGPVEEIFDAPRHPYTRALVKSLPVMGEKIDRLPSISGHPPDLAALPPGCPFADRCPNVTDQCREEAPPVEGTDAHWYRCWNPETTGD